MCFGDLREEATGGRERVGCVGADKDRREQRVPIEDHLRRKIRENRAIERELPRTALRTSPK